MQRDIDDFKPGTKIAITEYNYGGGNHISGAIAQADVLGIFGREGVFAASLWELDSGSSFVNAAFNMYLNYDGAGGQFGDTSIDADTSNIANSAVYASVDSSDPNRMVVVAINRTANALTTGIAVTHDRVFDHAEVYRLTGSSSQHRRSRPTSSSTCSTPSNTRCPPTASRRWCSSPTACPATSTATARSTARLHRLAQLLGQPATSPPTPTKTTSSTPKTTPSGSSTSAWSTRPAAAAWRWFRNHPS